jgi:hypothetical protein
MRALGRLTLFVVVSSGTITCLAHAQPTRAARERVSLASGLVDPWGPPPVHEPPRDPVPLVDPWPSHTPAELQPHELIIIDPWRSEPAGALRQVETVELIDPWRDALRPMPAQADFSIVDPWGHR